MHKTLSNLIVGLALGVVLLTAATAQQPPTTRLTITLSTKTMQMPTIPGLPAGMQIPGMGAGMASHEITGHAIYGNKPVAPLYVTVPADLKLPNNRLILYLPGQAPIGHGAAGADDEGGEQPEAKGNMELVNKLYWHPNEAKGPLTETVKVKDGKLVEGNMGTITMPGFEIALPDDPKAAYGQASDLPAGVIGKGDYVCNTGGTAALDGFLPALKVKDFDVNTADLNAGFTLKWDPVKGARGYLISITAMSNMGDEGDAKMTITSWYSTLTEPPARLRGGYQKDTTIAADLESGLLLPGDTTSCVVPAGMFGEFGFASIRVEAIGNDFYSNAGPTVFGLVRSEWMATKMDLGMMNQEEEDNN